MKQQVFVVHGGNAFGTYNEYIAYLRAKIVDLGKLLFKDWKDGLQERLGDRFSVYLFKMPNGQNAKYVEWAIWFEKYVPLMDEGVVLVGHSLGAVFLAKYLSENTFPKRIKGVFLVAAPYDADEGRMLPEFAITTPLEKLAVQAGRLYMYHSKDDPVVLYEEFEKYRRLLGNKATYRVFEDRLHFNLEDFPELAEDIRLASEG